MMENLTPCPLDDITEENYYSILNVINDELEYLINWKGIPLKCLAVTFPYILTDRGVIDVRQVELVKLSKEFGDIWNRQRLEHPLNKYTSMSIDYSNQDSSTQPWW